jgi:hypothetical protein
VTNWSIQIPYTSRSNSLSEVAEAARALPTDEARIVRALVLDEITGGQATTAGELLDKLEQASPGERRELLDAARLKVGLPDTETVEGRRRFEAASAAATAQAGAESGWQFCHAEGCDAIPMNHLGAPTPTDAARWSCPAHRDQAAPGDMDPRPSRLRYAPSGAIVEVDPVEDAKQAAAEESRRRQLEHQAADRVAEAEAARVNREARCPRRAPSPSMRPPTRRR